MSEAIPRLDIRSMTQAEVEQIALEWAAAENWNPGFPDHLSFNAADPGGFLLGLLNGEPVSCISAIRYGSDYGFLGFYIVKPELRGKGFGMQVWRAAEERLAGRNVGLDGVLAQVSNYEKSGFKAAYHNVRYGGVPTPSDQPVLGVVPLAEVPFDQLLEYDTRHFPAPRREFIKEWTVATGTSAFGVVKEGVLKGYAVIRPARTGFRIGPLFADEPIDAERLFLAMVKAIPQGEAVYLDVPDVNLEAVWLADMYGLEPGFECVRMYTKGTPDLPIGQVFGNTSLELG